MFVTSAWAAGPPAGGGGSMITSFIPLILIFVIFYFLLIRPQQKKAKEHRLMLDAIKKGDKVVTSGGIYGVVEQVEQNTILVKIAENVKVKVRKDYIATVRTEKEPE
ncbi:MAG: preprotein translocase subunit YajC [Nitrospiraceae bacterium]|nr:preprotein translocase subunit YajC [Nitrospiraceae bacterium]MDA8327071.1 preprotein translocase subunit YajC [Nitrospiraceae bacterium]